MSALCIGSLPDFCYCLLLFSLGCVYLCSNLPCTFDGWVLILDFYLQGLSFCPSWKRFLLMKATTWCPQNKNKEKQNKVKLIWKRHDHLWKEWATIPFRECLTFLGRCVVNTLKKLRSICWWWASKRGKFVHISDYNHVVRCIHIFIHVIFSISSIHIKSSSNFIPMLIWIHPSSRIQLEHLRFNRLEKGPKEYWMFSETRGCTYVPQGGPGSGLNT